VSIRWGRAPVFTVTLPADAGIDALKRGIEAQTRVKPKRQKLLGLHARAVAQGLPVGDLIKGRKGPIMMVGSLEKDIETVQRKSADAVAGTSHRDDDGDGDEEADLDALRLHEREENRAKVRHRVAKANIKMLGEPRAGKKLLVLDVDYTLFDHKSPAERPCELRRPFLFEFLASAYRDYDIVIWSATSMKWVELKMKELGVLDDTRDFKLLAMMDFTAMISVNDAKRGTIDCKPLDVIWDKSGGQWDRRNTIMFDDLRRNFVMNPENGLKIRPFKHAHLNRDSDRELLKLSKYLATIATLDDFSKLDHRKWERYLRTRTKGQPN